MHEGFCIVAFYAFTGIRIGDTNMQSIGPLLAATGALAIAHNHRSLAVRLSSPLTYGSARSGLPRMAQINSQSLAKPAILPL